MKRALPILTLLLLLTGSTLHAEPVSGRQMQAQVYFPIGKSLVDPSFRDNGATLDAFVRSLKAVMADPNYVISRLSVYGTASPDGREEVNLVLAGQRAEALADYLVVRTGIAREKIEVVNNGENWSGLRAMIEASDMPYRNEMLRLLDSHSDRDSRKRAMQYYADSKPWLYMYEHFFPALRAGDGGTTGQPHQLTGLSRANWTRLREIIAGAALSDEMKRALLDAFDQEHDTQRREERLRAICGEEIYTQLQNQMLRGLLSTPSMLSADNWTVLRSLVAADADTPDREAVLRIIDSTPTVYGREQRLRTLNEGIPYRYIREHFFPRLLVDSMSVDPETSPGANADTVSTLSAENWKRLRAMIWVSEMPDKGEVVNIIDNIADPSLREQSIRDFNGGRAYRYINQVFFPELLYGIAPAAKENWEQLAWEVEHSDLPNREQILNIIASTPPGAERAEAITALDGGETWQVLGEMMMPELLQSTESVRMTNSGMAFYYELSPSARARASLAAYREYDPTEDAPVAEPLPEVAVATPEIQEVRPTPRQRRRLQPILALKTNLVLWGGVTPDFDISTYMPNLAAEFYFARRWSMEGGYVYSDWDYFSGDKFWAVSAFSLEPRFWSRGDGLFRGFYVGLYGQYGEFDNQQDAHSGGYQRTGTFFNIGASLGYVQTLSRHWYLEVGVKGGYRRADCDWYDIEYDNAGIKHHYFNRQQTLGKFSPGLRLNIMYRFGAGKRHNDTYINYK